MFKKITWLIVIRILLVTLFLGVGSLIFKIDKSFFYALIANLYFLSLVYLLLLVKRLFLKTLVIIQLLVDCVFVSIVVLYTGGVDSIFTTLYILIILNASVIVSPLVGMLTTAFAVLLYLSQLFIGYTNCISYLKISPWDHDLSIIIYSAHVHVVTFLLVGILAAALSRKVNQMEERVREKDRTALMGELAAQIAHEIRNPLATISGSIELLEEDLREKLDPKDSNVMKAIVSEAERVGGIFEQFLDFSKLDSLRYSHVSLKDVIDEIRLLLDKRYKSFSVDITFSCDGACVCECDRNRMKQVFWNIISNAIEAMTDGGRLHIEIFPKGNDMCIVFRDSGTGMNAEEIKELFTPFRSTKHEGSGLGMVIVKKIVENHGGSITVKSRKHEGTKVVISIPQKKGLA